MSISTPKVKQVPGGPVRVATAVLAAALAAVLALAFAGCSGDDDTTTEASHRAAIRVAEEQAAETSIDSAQVRDFEAERQVARARRRELAADNTADNRPCGRFSRYRFAVVKGDVSCRVARRVMRAYSINGEMPGSWSCYGSDSEWTCAPTKPGETIMAWVTCNANRLAHGDRNRSRCPGWIKGSEAQRRRATGAGGDHRVKLYTPHFESVFLVRSSLEPDAATADAGDLTIIWKNGADGPKHNICMEDEQGKPVFKKVVFNGGRERPAQATPRCSKKIRARTLRARAKVKPGEYTYYSSVGRQREDGMEGTLTVK